VLAQLDHHVFPDAVQEGHHLDRALEAVQHQRVAQRGRELVHDLTVVEERLGAEFEGVEVQHPLVQRARDLVEAHELADPAHLGVELRLVGPDVVDHIGEITDYVRIEELITRSISLLIARSISLRA
jgi:hypothetical protein